MREGGGVVLDDGQQEVVATRERLVMVSAAPGAGKTTALTARVAERIGQGQAHHRILVMTFTRRAARELVKRLGQRPEAAGLEKALRPPEERVLARIDDPAPLWIGTTHDVCQRILRCHAERVGRTAEMRVVGPEEANARMRDAMGQADALPDDEAGALLDALKDHALQERHIYRHRYSVGDLVVWDTLQTMHAAVPIDVATSKADSRLLWRISVRGRPAVHAAAAV